MKKYTNEFKVGLFVIFCLAGLFYLTYSTGKLDIRKKGCHIYVVFSETAGIKNKSPVMLNGYEVGKVDGIRFSYDEDKTRTILQLWLDDTAKVRVNPVVSIKTLGLMGEKYIEIASTEGKDFLRPGAVVEGKPFMDLDDMMEQAQALSKNISEQVNKLLANINGTLGENKESVAAIIKNLEQASKNFEDFSSDIKRHPWKLLFKTKEKPVKPKN